MSAFWAEVFVKGIITVYIVTAVWYLARTMEDKNGKQQH
jgi:hypothetical protein